MLGLCALACMSLAVAGAEPVAAAAGNVLVTPLFSKETVLIAPDGKEQHVWTSEYEAASGAHLLPDGSILRVAHGEMERPFQNIGLRGGRVQRLGWNGEVLWDFWNAGTFSMVSGEALMLPNGNILMATVERRSQEDALKAGRDRDRVKNQGLYLPGLMEVSPRGKDKGRIVWKWSAWDHVAQDRNPTLPNYDAKREQHRKLDINAFSGAFGLASVGLSYDESSDLILLTMPALGEFWLLDHGTTVQEAEKESGGKRQLGGGILWRWSVDTVLPNPPRVLSADFLPHEGATPGALPLIGVLALHGPQSENSMRLSLQKVMLKGMDLMPPVGRVTREVLQQWDAPFKTPFDLPGNLSAGAVPGAVLLSSTGPGVVSRTALTSPATALWTYHNPRGVTDQKVATGYVHTPCCGQVVTPSTDPAPARPPATAQVKAAFIGRARLYASGYIQAAAVGAGETNVAPSSPQ
jgi:hypothetical protein